MRIKTIFGDLEWLELSFYVLSIGTISMVLECT